MAFLEIRATSIVTLVAFLRRTGIRFGGKC
jgi:hypothetical protein